MENRVKALGGGVLLLAALSAGCANAGDVTDRQWTDAHLHYVDFMQDSEGAQAMIAAMDKAGVERGLGVWPAGDEKMAGGGAASPSLLPGR